jgi:PAS domain S-box-containing protein
VDDTAESLRVLTGILQPEGYSVRPANSGKLALASIAARPPDLILLDIRMPDLDGFEVCRRLKEEEATRKIPVIFLSAASDLADRLDGLRLGAVDYVTKPFQREELLARVRTHLELGRLREDLELLVKDRTAQLKLEIDERKQTEKHLKENEARYRALFEGVPDALLIADIATGVIRDVNPSACRLFARTRDELVGVHQSTLHPPRLARETEQSFRRHSLEVAEGKTGAPIEHAILRADGSEIPIEIGTQPVLLNGAKMILGVFRDISERKRAEELLHLQTVELKEEVAERQIAQEDLQEKALMLEEEIERRFLIQGELETLNEQLEQRVQERTAELVKANEELYKMNRLFVGRELKMVELKGRIKELESNSEKRGDQNDRQ